jgi:predicted transcriptional regulator
MFIVSSGTVVGERRELSEDQPLRKRIHAYVDSNPGVHLRDIKRNLDCAMGGLQYQLSQLEDEGIIKYIVKGNTKHFFIHDYCEDDRILLVMAHARNPIISEIIWSCVRENGLTRAELARKLGYDISVVSYYVNKLLTDDILKTIPVFGREKPLGVTDWAFESLHNWNIV